MMTGSPSTPTTSGAVRTMRGKQSFVTRWATEDSVDLRNEVGTENHC